MGALVDLFTSFSGLLSLAVIGFMLLMAVFLFRWVGNNVRKSLAEQERRTQGSKSSPDKQTDTAVSL
ncbi:DUF3149 domain-containing protein [Microbulbifer spongiae]|uniref:DUF3149 domain-containing protein n=1 Tax=Microbulbifer spongiae TaxID=2944933 RepID=A0ABY9E965_9GAMM|nr:DUF3149 domain-containing protein [Microbulbifer sp. MI-G]WKD49599.1 DUF3149 domain-containing protein [Microbulbifer sp. MI-G]